MWNVNTPDIPQPARCIVCCDRGVTEEEIKVVGLDICRIPQVLDKFYLKHILTEDTIYIEMFSFSKQSTHIRRSERVWHDCVFMFKFIKRKLFVLSSHLSHR